MIIGSGPAGLTAAVYGARADLEPLVFMGTKYGGQLMVTSEVENFPGFVEPILGPELMERMKAQAERVGARLVQEDTVRVNFKRHPFEVATPNQTVKALSVIIATGADPKRLNLNSETRLMGRGVSSCAVCDGFFYKGKRVAVVGGGDTAMEEATFLTKFATGVQVIHRRDSLRASKALQKRAFSNGKINFTWGSEVVDVLGTNRVEGVKIRNLKTGKETETPLEGLFVAIGYEPNTKVFAGQLELDSRGYVIAKNGTETSVPGVFVAGDAHDHRYRQAVTAAGDGCRALMDAEKFLEEKRVLVS